MASNKKLKSAFNLTQYNREINHGKLVPYPNFGSFQLEWG